jgi:predicted HNH restriction endonuclease
LVYAEIHEIKDCHIQAASELGPRYNPQQTEKERHGYANLIILCPNCHADIDKNPQKYSVEYLQNLKQQHEAKYEKEQYHPDDEAIDYYNRAHSIDPNYSGQLFNKLSTAEDKSQSTYRSAV